MRSFPNIKPTASAEDGAGLLHAITGNAQPSSKPLTRYRNHHYCGVLKYLDSSENHSSRAYMFVVREGNDLYYRKFGVGLAQLRSLYLVLNIFTSRVSRVGSM